MQLYCRLGGEDSFLIRDIEKLMKARKENGRPYFKDRNDLLIDLIARGIKDFYEENDVKET